MSVADGSSDPISLAGRVALVTGAGSATGIGFATAQVLARRGASVAVAATTERIHERAEELRSAGYSVQGFTADLTSGEQARALAEAVVSRFGPVEILVNNAGMIQTGVPDVSKRFHELSDGEWDHIIRLNLATTVNATRSVLPAMLERRYGRIVNVSSVTGPVVANPGSTGYSTAKSAIDGLTRSLAVEVGPDGITVNSVAPGWIATGSSSEQELLAGRHTPVGRPGTPQEVAELIAFLASDASRYVTGRSIVIDGGNILQEYKGPAELYY
jgi:3-oxoacyl-[acyl-carrier protein] reductase